MSETLSIEDAKNKKPGRRKRGLLFGLLALLALGGGGAGAYVLVPGAAEAVQKLTGLGGGGHAPAAEATKPTFVELPEMTLTLPNAGRPRQLRVKLAVEVVREAGTVQPEVLNPRVYDSLVLYLRTLRDGEMDGSLALERLRGDLFRRLSLLLGPNTVRDVLITGFVVA